MRFKSANIINLLERQSNYTLSSSDRPCINLTSLELKSMQIVRKNDQLRT